MKLNNFVSCATVANILKSGGFKDGYRLIDCTSRIAPRPNHEEYKKLVYGKFEQMMAAETRQKKGYWKNHIPCAVHLDLNTATYPSEYTSYAFYPPEIFQQYIRLLGVNVDDQLILYSRGAIGGMMIPACIAWIFKCYGHDRVSVLDGGLSRWEKEIGEVTDELPVVKPGNWTASEISEDRLVSFEEIMQKEWLNKLDTINFLDARTKGQFDGVEATTLDHRKVKGSHVAGVHNVPAVDSITKEGVLKSESELKKWLEENGFQKGKPIVTMCNKGIQAAMLALIMEHVDKSSRARVYMGSMKEIELRDPEKINAGRIYTP
ncbi:unnamed protein product [Anisakis simplex]|uniref:Putative thiosulfate sulfurtransferase (inferred by orthology to a C. elegans protein) n=1 Tax=Anisakis simplex TaxID=6269 RepID=A0A0M3JRF7_ANISI|nr:unnamed protein product [Anisakis simplex]